MTVGISVCSEIDSSLVNYEICLSDETWHGQKRKRQRNEGRGKGERETEREMEIERGKRWQLDSVDRKAFMVCNLKV